MQAGSPRSKSSGEIATLPGLMPTVTLLLVSNTFITMAQMALIVLAVLFAFIDKK